MNVTYVYGHIDALLNIGPNLKRLTSLAYVIVYLGRHFFYILCRYHNLCISLDRSRKFKNSSQFGVPYLVGTSN